MSTSDSNTELSVADTLALALAKSLEVAADVDISELARDISSATGIDLSARQIELITDIAPKLMETMDSLEVEASVSNIEKLLRHTIDLIKVLSRMDGGPLVPSEVSSRLIGYFVGNYLWGQRPGIASLLALMGVLDGPTPIALDYEEDADFRNGEEDLDEDPVLLLGRSRLRLDRLAKFLQSPEDWASEFYQWGGNFDFRKLSERVYGLMMFAGLDAGKYASPPWAAFDQDEELRVTLFRYGDVISSFGEITLAFGQTPRGFDSHERVLVTLTMLGRLEETLLERPDLTVKLQTELDLSDGASVLFAPYSAPSFFVGTGYEIGGADVGQLELTFEVTEQDTHFWYRFGGMHLYTRGEKLLLGLKGDLLDPELVVELDIDRFEFGIDTSEADAFLSNTLPSDVVFGLNLALGYSSQRGFYIGGGGGLEAVVPLRVELGPLHLQELSVGLGIDGDTGMNFAARVSASFELGPVKGVVSQIGMRAAVLFDLGRDDAFQGFTFVPPDGVGLALDSAGLTGGGFLDFDDENKRYAGIVQLSAGELELVGIGLITTRMPDGSDGFSLLINIGVEFSPPIQLPYGFTLSGVGGLIALNRTMDVDVLRAGLRARTLDSILFPEDPIANAAQIVSNLRSVFPPMNDRVVVGPMIKLGWGSPRIVQADLGIFMELPGPERVVILGQISVALPQEHNAVIELHMDVLGEIDFKSETVKVDSTIYDSRIYKYALTGDAAARFSWGDSPSLALSLGGFHPDFSPPAGFPALRRLTLDLSQGRNLQLYCSAYQAITSNTVQFGATVVLLARKSGARLEGTLSFDTLIYLSPFSFAVNISGNVAARYRGRKLASVWLRMRLSGPTPWKARGRASFGVLCWDVSVRFNETWGPRERLEIEPVDAWLLLKEALERDESWGARLPSGISAVEALASQEGDENALLVHPMGYLEVRQNVLPLEIELQKIGGAPLRGQSYFSIDRVTVQRDDLEATSEPVTELEVADVMEDFARAQFITLSDSERLTMPSFEKMKAGVSLGAVHIDFGSGVESSRFEYETILIREDRTSSPTQLEERSEKAPRAATVELKRQVQASAAARCELRKTGRRKYAVAGKQKAVKLLNDQFQVVNTDTLELEPVSDGDKKMGRLQAEQAMFAYLKSKPELAGHLRVTPAGGVAR